jgi:hypothetical protein
VAAALCTGHQLPRVKPDARRAGARASELGGVAGDDVTDKRALAELASTTARDGVEDGESESAGEVGDARRVVRGGWTAY